MAEPLEALVLAGRRGPDDALAEQFGASHRALLPVHGVPSLLRVVRVLGASERFDAIHVSIDEPERIDEVPELAALAAYGTLTVHPSEASPSRSVRAVIEPRDAAFLVTTADHALLTTAMLDHFLGEMGASPADVLVAVVAKSLLAPAYPGTKRTYLEMRSEAWSGANLFGFRTRKARKAAAFWTRAERYRKQPWRMVSAIGADIAALYMAGRLELDDALARASNRIGAEVRAVRMPIPEAAIDVDRASDVELATRILEAREA